MREIKTSLARKGHCNRHSLSISHCSSDDILGYNTLESTEIRVYASWLGILSGNLLNDKYVRDLIQRRVVINLLP